jgi:8-oxo-dGTP pyrophosphatase MutT (NUDIX family)
MRLNVSIPPLDALIIPKAVCECKTIRNLIADLSDVYLFTTLYHTIASFSICYNRKMETRKIELVVKRLKECLEPAERAEELVDSVEGERSQARKAAVLVPIFERHGEIFLAFIRRSSTLRAHSGEIAFPGGKREEEDTSAIQTALREAEEEVGLHSGRVEVLGVLQPVFTVVSNYLITPVVGYLPTGLGDVKLQSSEVAELLLIPLHELENPAIFHSKQWTREQQSRTIYFYDFGPYTIWGATGRILHALLGLLSTK